MRYLLDTNVVIRSMARNDRSLERRMRIHRHEAALSAVVLHELCFGAFKGTRQEESLAAVTAVALPLIPFDADDARAAGEIRANLRRKGTPIGPYDVLIAGQARARGLTVVTRNVREIRRVEGLRVEEWAA